MSQLLPYIMPDWLAGVEEGSAAAPALESVALRDESLNVGRVPRGQAAQQVLVRQPVDLDDDEAGGRSSQSIRRAARLRRRGPIRPPGEPGQQHADEFASLQQESTHRCSLALRWADPAQPRALPRAARYPR